MEKQDKGIQMTLHGQEGRHGKYMELHFAMRMLQQKQMLNISKR